VLKSAKAKPAKAKKGKKKEAEVAQDQPDLEEYKLDKLFSKAVAMEIAQGFLGWSDKVSILSIYFSFAAWVTLARRLSL